MTRSPLTHNLSSKIPQLFKKVILILCVFSFFGCQSLDRQKVAKDEEIISTQLAVIGTQVDKGKPQQALRTIQPLLKKFPDNYKVQTMHGVIHIALNNNVKAIKILRNAYNIKPSPAAGLNLSSALIANQNYQRAKNVLFGTLKKNQESFPRKERLYHNLGYIYEKERNFKQAIKYYEKALAENPSFYLTLMSIGKVYRKTNQPEKAKIVFRKATRSCHLCFEATHLLTTLQINSQQYDNAKKTLKTYLSHDKITPEDMASAKNLLNIVQRYDKNQNNKRNISKHKKDPGYSR